MVRHNLPEILLLASLGEVGDATSVIYYFIVDQLRKLDEYLFKERRQILIAPNYVEVK